MAQVATKIINREQWLTERRKGIGGSDAAAILGLNPWRSPFDVYLDKIGEAPERAAGEAAYWGNVLEDVVAREFTARTGLKVQRRNAILQHPEHEWMIASIDREIVARPRGVLEAKTTSAWQADEWAEDRAPDMYVVQVQHYLAVTGWSYGYLAVLIGGNKFLVAKVDRDNDLIQTIIDAEAEFWQQVEDHIPPSVDGSDACTAALKCLYPRSEEQAIILPDDARHLLSDYQAADAAVKEAAAVKQRYQNELMALMGESDTAYLPGQPKPVCTWKNTERKGYTVQPTTYRQFRVKGEE